MGVFQLQRALALKSYPHAVFSLKLNAVSTGGAKA